MPKVKERAHSVAAARILQKIRPGMPPDQVTAIEEEANNQALSDVYGVDWRERVTPDGRIEENGIGSTIWLLNHTEAECANHYAAIGKFIGPAAEKAERERIARLRGKKS
jgi:hypothetical protein